MDEQPDKRVLEAVSRGDERAFETLYRTYHQQARLMAWRISHRPDWVEEIVHDAWCRAFANRRSYQPNRAFLVWLAGIQRIVYLEMCRKSPTTLGDALPPDAGHNETPESIVAEAETLAVLNDCVSRLPELDAKIIRLRFFDNLTLRDIAKELAIPEATLREARLPAALQKIEHCLEKKGRRISTVFPAREAGEPQ